MLPVLLDLNLFCNTAAKRLELPNFMPRGSLALPDFPGLFKYRIENGFQNRR